MKCHCQYCAKPFNRVAADLADYRQLLDQIAEYKARVARHRFVPPALPSLAVTQCPPPARLMLTCNGESLPISKWSKRLGIGITTLKGRKASGWSDEAVLTTPVKGRA